MQRPSMKIAIVGLVPKARAVPEIETMALLQHFEDKGSLPPGTTPSRLMALLLLYISRLPGLCGGWAGRHCQVRRRHWLLGGCVVRVYGRGATQGPAAFATARPTDALRARPKRQSR